MSLLESTSEKTGLRRAIAPLGRNVFLLSFCQALGFAGVPLSFLTGGIVGAELAPSRSLATLPIAVVVVGNALASIPAAMLMKRIGRKRGFIGAAIVASMVALGAAFAISIRSFPLFSLMLLFIGAAAAFVQQYRFAAAESVAPRYAGRAISFVLIGGILGGFLGPEIGRGGRDWLSGAAYSGSFVGLAMVYAILAIVLLFIRNVGVKEVGDARPERPLKALVTQPTYLVAVLSSTVAFGVMAFIMSATPVSMNVMDHFSLNNTTRVVQSHIIAMYVPSLFSGFLVEQLKPKVLQTSGVISMGVAVAIAVSGHSLSNYLIALMFLGVGWNFLYVAGTVMLTQSYYPVERFKAQGINDFAVFAVQVPVILLAGAVLSAGSWEMLNLAVLPVLLFTLIVVLTMRFQAPK